MTNRIEKERVYCPICGAQPGEHCVKTMGDRFGRGGEDREPHAARGRPTKTVRCAYCGRRHRLRPAFVGYEENALCARCERDQAK